MVGLSCSTWDLQSSLGHGESLVVECKLLVAECGILFPDKGSNPGPLHWENGVLATGPQRSPFFRYSKCPSLFFWDLYCLYTGMLDGIPQISEPLFIFLYCFFLPVHQIRQSLVI